MFSLEKAIPIGLPVVVNIIVSEGQGFFI